MLMIMREMIVIMMLLMGIWMLMQRGLAVPVHARAGHKLEQSRREKQRTGIRRVTRSLMPACPHGACVDAKPGKDDVPPLQANKPTFLFVCF